MTDVWAVGILGILLGMILGCLITGHFWRKYTEMLRENIQALESGIDEAKLIIEDTFKHIDEAKLIIKDTLKHIDDASVAKEI